MTDYVVPSGVRIADADRVRLGAHLAPGTTVMHEGFVNFNAGTLGTSMVEGRIVAGVVVGDGSDIGAGASIMGTLSGGGKEVDPHRRAVPARRQRRHRHLARRRLRGRGRLLHHRRLEDHPAGRPGRQGPRALRRSRACCSGATRSPAPSRPAPAPGRRHRAQRRPARQLTADCGRAHRMTGMPSTARSRKSRTPGARGRTPGPGRAPTRGSTAVAGLAAQHDVDRLRRSRGAQ